MDAVRIIVHIRVKNKFNQNKMKKIYRQAAIDYLIGFVENAKKNSGCISIDLLQNEKDGDEFSLVELWESKSAFDEHISSTYFQKISQFLAEYADSMEIHRMQRIH